MSKSFGINTEAVNTSNTTTLVDVNQSNLESGSEIINIRIPDTAFNMVGNKELGWFISFGKYKVTEQFKNLEEKVGSMTEETAEQILHQELPNIIVNLFALFTEFTKIDVINQLTKEQKLINTEIDPNQIKLELANNDYDPLTDE